MNPPPLGRVDELLTGQGVLLFSSAIASPSAASRERLKLLTVVSALGIVYGDIGTSPLYVHRAIARITGGRFDQISALGSLSLIFWTLIIVVTIKYALIVMRADNRGEGGILALMSVTRASWRGRNRYLIIFGLLGAALLYGDGVITPAISVLSAVEGLKVASNDLAAYTMPIAVAILFLLFVVQRFGTAAVGRAFGPLMLIWFVFIAVLGTVGILSAPHVLVAADPRYAAAFLFHDARSSLVILAAVFLCVTGAEAMYADMGHLGRAPIRLAWTVIVLPAISFELRRSNRHRLDERRWQWKSVLRPCGWLATISGSGACHVGDRHC